MAIIDKTYNSKSFYKLGLIGYAKKHKTRTAATAPEPFFISCGDGGLKSALPILAARKAPVPYGIEIWDVPDEAPSAWFKVKIITGAFITGEPFEHDGVTIDPKKYKTFVVDHFSDLSSFIFYAGTAAARKDKQGDTNTFDVYGYYKNETRKDINITLQALARKMNVVIIFHTENKMMHTPDGKEILQRQRPFMDGNAVEQIIPPWFDGLWAMDIEGKYPEEIPVAYTRKHEKQVHLGSRLRWLEKITNPDLTLLFKEIREG